MKHLTVVGLAVVVGLIAAALAGPMAAGADEPAKATRLQLVTEPLTDTRGRLVPGQTLLTARLRTDEGQPVNNQEVLFYQVIEFFGPRAADLGAATTDSTGRAAVVFQPAQPGQQTIKAYFAGTPDYTASETSQSFTASTVVPPFESMPPPLALVRPWVPVALGVLMLAVWATLLGVFLTSVVGIRTAARTSGRPPTDQTGLTGIAKGA
jgi:hypothetical protein